MESLHIFYRLWIVYSCGIVLVYHYVEEKRMIIQRPVKKDLQDVIDVIWYVNEEHLPEEKQKDVIIPSGQIHLVYNFSKPHYLNVGNELHKLPNTLLAGPFKDVKEVRYEDSVKQLGIAFKPSAFYTLFKELPSLYSHVFVDCSGMDFLKGLHLHIEAMARDHFPDGKRMLDDIETFFESFEYEHVNDEGIDQILRYIDEEKGDVNVADLAKKFSYSMSALERNFKKYLGLAPKVYANMLKFKYALADEDPVSLFYDQSHFIKSCQKYTRKLPKELLDAEEISLLYMLQVSDE